VEVFVFEAVGLDTSQVQQLAHLFVDKVPPHGLMVVIDEESVVAAQAPFWVFQDQWHLLSCIESLREDAPRLRTYVYERLDKGKTTKWAWQLDFPPYLRKSKLTCGISVVEGSDTIMQYKGSAFPLGFVEVSVVLASTVYVGYEPTIHLVDITPDPCLAAVLVHVVGTYLGTPTEYEAAPVFDAPDSSATLMKTSLCLELKQFASNFFFFFFCF
jgi:hypothetical protein